MATQLKVNQLASVRVQLAQKQGNKCAVCNKGFTHRDPMVLDHDHDTGYIRGVLHKSCNGQEGRVKVLAYRCHTGVGAYEYLIGLGKYLEQHSSPQIPYLHPTHRSPQMLREERNRKAREARKRKKLLEK